MTKKHFIALADTLRAIRKMTDPRTFDMLVTAVCGYCYRMNPRFNEERFVGYIAGTCGPNGGALKRK